jgi:hypothetical protein
MSQPTLYIVCPKHPSGYVMHTVDRLTQQDRRYGESASHLALKIELS